MNKKTTTYTWNEDLQRVISGEMPQEIEAYQHDKRKAQPTKYAIDDHSQFLPRGYRRSEEWIAKREAQEKAEQLAQAKRRSLRQTSFPELNDSHPNNDNSNDDDVKHNGNTRQSSPDVFDGIGGAYIFAAFILAFMLFAIFTQK